MRIRVYMNVCACMCVCVLVWEIPKKKKKGGFNRGVQIMGKAVFHVLWVMNWLSFSVCSSNCRSNRKSGVTRRNSVILAEFGLY